MILGGQLDSDHDYESEIEKIIDSYIVNWVQDIRRKRILGEKTTLESAEIAQLVQAYEDKLDDFDGDGEGSDEILEIMHRVDLVKLQRIFPLGFPGITHLPPMAPDTDTQVPYSIKDDIDWVLKGGRFLVYKEGTEALTEDFIKERFIELLQKIAESNETDVDKLLSIIKNGDYFKIKDLITTIINNLLEVNRDNPVMLALYSNFSQYLRLRLGRIPSKSIGAVFNDLSDKLDTHVDDVSDEQFKLDTLNRFEGLSILLNIVKFHIAVKKQKWIKEADDIGKLQGENQILNEIQELVRVFVILEMEVELLAAEFSDL